VSFAERTAVAGRPLEGEVWLHPSATFDAPLAIDHRGRHFWWGVAPHSRAEVEIRRPRGLRFSGHAYHDANFGSEPLEAGFRRWNWSRARLGDQTVVLYDSERRDGSRGAITRSFAADGELGDFALPQPIDLGRTRWGIDRATRCDAGGRARVVRSLEDTPFYARSEILTDIGGAQVAAVHESLDLDRFKRPLIQHMLTYRIRREGLR
jgi:carotenoid 1,2-hydratase